MMLGTTNIKLYEEHVTALAERLREANTVASLHSKMSHETAKRYYDRQTKLEQYTKGTLVYLYDPTHKTKLNSVALVRERTIPTERPPAVGEVSANFCG